MRDDPQSRRSLSPEDGKTGVQDGLVLLVLLDPSHRRKAPSLSLLLLSLESYGQSWYREGSSSTARLRLGVAVYHCFSIFFFLRLPSSQSPVYTYHHKGLVVG
jgi:hypothetical protein